MLKYTFKILLLYSNKRVSNGVGVDNYTVVYVHNEKSNKFDIQDNKETKNIILAFKYTLQNFTINLIIFRLSNKK